MTMVDTSDDVLPASFQPWQRASSETKSFENALARIYAERGHFRHLSEAQLRAETAANAITGTEAISPADSDLDDVDAKDAVGDTRSQTDRLAQARRDAIEHVASAQNEALLALDFISLLLSKDIKQAESTISPILKQSVPPGTLGLDMWAGMAPDTKQEETDQYLARGKRMECLTQGADALMAAGTRLKATVDREWKYWDEVLRVREQGWSVCRMPREKGVLGVRYGFPEAQGEFARRGLAALKMGAGGDVVLDRGLGTETKSLRVKILRDGVTESEASIDLNPTDNDVDVEGRIRLARDSLFEEELWHEAMRESRLLGSYGVQMEGNTISMPMSYQDTQGAETKDSATIEVDLVAGGSKSGSTGPSMLADSVATTLRLLLLHSHRRRLEKRSEIPPPISSKPVEKQVAELLRPLLSGLHHQSAITKLAEQIAPVTQLLTKVGVITSQTTNRELAKKLTSCTTLSDLFSVFSQPHVTELSLTVTLPTPTSDSTSTLDITIRVTTWLSPPTSRGTTFYFSSPSLPSFDRSTPSLALILEHIVAALQHALADAMGAWLPGWNRDPLAGTVTRPVLRRNGGTDVVALRLGQGVDGYSLALRAGTDEVLWSAAGGETRSFAQAMVGLAETVGP